MEQPPNWGNKALVILLSLASLGLLFGAILLGSLESGVGGAVLALLITWSTLRFIADRGNRLVPAAALLITLTVIAWMIVSIALKLLR